MNCSLASKSSQKSSFIFFYTIKLMCYRMMSQLCIVGVPTFAWLDSNSSGLTFSKATSNLRLAIKIVAQQLGGKVAFWPRERSTAIEVVAAAVAGGWGVARAKILHFGGIRPRLPFRKSPILQGRSLLCYLNSFTIYVQQEKLSATTAKLRLQRALWLVKPYRKTEFGSHPLKLPAPSWVLLHF